MVRTFVRHPSGLVLTMMWVAVVVALHPLSFRCRSSMFRDSAKRLSIFTVIKSGLHDIVTFMYLLPEIETQSYKICLRERLFLILDTRGRIFGRGMNSFPTIMWGFENTKSHFYGVQNYLA